MELDHQIEAILFYKAAPMEKLALAKLLDVTPEAIENAISSLKQRLTGGVVLVENEKTVELGTAPAADDLIESLRKDELNRDIGKAGAETLAIVLYRGPISRVEIDRIRGVNSGYILRNLEVRGLVEKVTEKNQNVFRPTTDLLKHLGIAKKSELNSYQSVMNALEAYETSLNEN